MATVAIDPDTKLIPVWHVADRSAQSAYRLMRNLQPRLKHRVQTGTAPISLLLRPRLKCLLPNTKDGAGRYSPAGFVGETITVVSGNPDRDLISTSHAERQNLTMRMQIRRFTRRNRRSRLEPWRPYRSAGG